MPAKLNVYILGDYKPGAADGLTEFSYQNYLLLKDVFSFQFVEFDDHRNTEYYTLELRDGIPIHRFGSKDIMLYQLPKLFPSWLKDLPRDNTVFHLNHIYNLTNFLVSRLLSREQIHYLVTPHDAYVYGEEYKNKYMSFPKRWYRNIYVRIFDKYVLDNASVVHALTPQCTDSLSPLTRTPVEVVGNQVAEIASEFDVSKVKPQVCFIGRFHISQKGIDLALKAFQLFKEETGNKDVTFILIGPANEQEKLISRRITKNLGLQIGKDVIFTDLIAEAERNKILVESKAYIQLSRSEGFGLSVVQALSCYKPVIVSTQIPISDKIKMHHAGFVVADEHEAAKALEQIFSLSEAEYITMAMNARHCYVSEFHPDVIKPRLIDLYEKAASNK